MSPATHLQTVPLRKGETEGVTPFFFFGKTMDFPCKNNLDFPCFEVQRDIFPSLLVFHHTDSHIDVFYLAFASIKKNDFFFRLALAFFYFVRENVYPVYTRRLDPSVLPFSLHSTDTHLYVFSLPLVLPVVHNKIKSDRDQFKFVCFIPTQKSAWSNLIGHTT